MQSNAGIACLTLLLIAAGSGALAQSSSQPPEKGEVYRGTRLDDEHARFEQCMRDWDATTHMTKREWERTCRRVADEREKYLREHGYVPDRKKAPARSKQTDK
jgi:hypothetical protein